MSQVIWCFPDKVSEGRIITMSLDDLNLEFEDEDEVKKKRGDAVQVDVDLEFHLDSPRPAAPRPPVQPARPAASASAQVKDINQARSAAQAPAAKPAMARPQASTPVAATSGSAALKMAPAGELTEAVVDLESQEIIRLREEAQQAKIDAEVKVQVAEFKTDLLVDLMSDMKLMDHQINQMLARIHAKHPDMKQEVLMIKKLLADFTSKKRK